MERVGGLEFRIDAQARPYAAGQVLDYMRDWRGEGFAIRPATGCC